MYFREGLPDAGSGRLFRCSSEFNTTTTHNYKCGARAVNFRALTADRALLQSFAVLHTENVLVKLYPSVIGGD